MGLFSYVDFQCDCPSCGVKVTEFQTKDGLCCMEVVNPWEVVNFYTSCKSCGAWIEYTKKSEKPEAWDLLKKCYAALITGDDDSDLIAKLDKFFGQDSGWLRDYELTIRKENGS